MIAALFCVAFQATSNDVETLSKLIDDSLKGSRWSVEGAPGTSRTKEKTVRYDYGGKLQATLRIRLHDQPDFWESGDPRRHISLYGKTVSSEKGRNWSAWLFDYSESERRADNRKPVRTNASIVFHHGKVGGSLYIRSSETRGHIAEDQAFALATLKTLASQLKKQFERS